MQEEEGEEEKEEKEDKEEKIHTYNAIFCCNAIELYLWAKAIVFSSAQGEEEENEEKRDQE